MNNEGQNTQIVEGAANAPEGTFTTPTTDEVGQMYKELGIKASAPTGAVKGRPKSSDIRTEDVSKDDDADSKSGREDNKSSDVKSKDAPADGKNGVSGDNADSKASKDSPKDGKIQDESKKTDGGVRKDKPATDKDSERGSEDGADAGASGAGQATDDKDGSEEETEDVEEGKRPGKSNPKVEQRFQKLNAEIKARDELIEKQAKQLEESQQKQYESQVAHEDPEYTVDDFRKVRDEDGNVLDLDENQAELAWRRWKDGFDQRKNEREAAHNHEKAVAESQQKASEALMRSSVEAYDTLTGILDAYPELSEASGKFDQEFSSLVMPIIEEAVIYQEGTEPGNKDGYNQVIVGLKMNPKKILEAMNAIKKSKRNLPLNGLNDNVETRSNVQVSHGRSSDTMVQAANELYQELGIKKRI